MAIILDPTGKTYRPKFYSREDDFEKVVVALSEQIFGASTIYMDVKKRVQGNELITVPDGYVIDMTAPDSPQLFVIENEISKHHLFKHIADQLLRFAVSFEEATPQIRSFLMEEIRKNPDQLQLLQRCCEESRFENVDSYLDAAVYRSFSAIVVIDEATDELHKIIQKIRATISVIQLQTFESEDGDQIHQFDTLYDDDDGFPLPFPDDPDASKTLRKQRRAQSDTIVVPAREEGFVETALGEERWYAIRIGAAMRDRIKYIAFYRVAPVSAVTHVAAIKSIEPYEDTGKFLVNFEGKAEEISPVPLKNPNSSPQGPIYVRRDALTGASSLEDALERTLDDRS